MHSRRQPVSLFRHRRRGRVTALRAALVAAAVTAAVRGDVANPSPPTDAPPLPRIARLGEDPDWSRLDRYQFTITREEFAYLLDHCYARSPSEYEEVIRLQPDRALILRQSNLPEAGWYVLHFRNANRLSTRPPRYWRRPGELEDLPAGSSRPLEGLRIAIDPGHIGGRWVTWDDRHFKIGRDTLPVKEGEMTLRVARILEHDLSLLGAEVFLTRRHNHPVTAQRAETLRDDARLFLRRRDRVPSPGLIATTAKKMFAISSEIRARAERLNRSVQPDLALCLHFNASPWRDPRNPRFRSPNHLHLLLNGCYSRGEILEDDTRLEMLLRILQRVYYEELGLANALSRTMERETRLPAFHYDGTWGKSVNRNEFVWARNLLANRIFLCPVIYFEPYCMNHREIHARVQAGEYEGLREFDGVYRKNIYQEYADGVTAGLVDYFRRHR